ncbi:hypothetical protein MPH_06389 [Macrophomina phaseolina MS6]|uniref:Heterokaryon incompatibility domain-containing protein n=1 Tax=Macrophomina phaseolina (strain MS6) TaxID=1126212 RepID=K2SHT8_MACPH|nr:hypothetical protein MPH_06389 [Macrophomina phaseolina MS6]
MPSNTEHSPFSFTAPKYEPLPTPTSIRLLKIIGRNSHSHLNPLHRKGKLIGPTPSICGNPLIQCTLETYELADAPPYACLSYTWGSPEPDRVTRGIDLSRDDYGPATKWPVAVDGQLFFVRKNLFDALQQFHPDKSVEDVNRTDPDEYYKTRLIKAAEDGRLWEVRRLLEKGASVGAKDCFDETALHYAAENGHYDIVKELVSAGADMGSFDETGRTPLQCSLQRERGEYKKVRKFLWDEQFRNRVLQLHHKEEEEWQRLSDSDSDDESSDDDDSDSDGLSDSGSEYGEGAGPGERILWVDAICINQDDLEERAAQVKIMSRIYDKALEVLVWLGEGLDNARLLQAAISRVNKEDGDLDELARKWRNSLTNFIREGFGDEDAELPEDCILAPAEIEEMSQWLTRAWFTRTWVVQELSLAQRVRMFAGSVEFCWPDVLKFLSLMARVGYFDNSTFWRLDNGIRKQDGIGGDCSEAWKLAEIRLRTRGNASEWALLDSVFRHDDSAPNNPHILRAGRLSLPIILSLCWTFQSKDPRDKIFALLTITRPLPEPDRIQIDYSTPVERLYTQVGHLFLRGSGDDAMYLSGRDGSPDSLEPLEGLSYVQDPFVGPRCRMPGLPTWAPDFSTPHVTTRIWRRRFCAATALAPSFGPGPADPAVLRTQALLWDEVVAVEDLSRRDQEFTIDVPPWLEMVMQLQEEGEKEGRGYPTGECGMQVLCRTLMADHLWVEGDVEEQERVRSLFREFLAWELANEVEVEGMGDVCHPHDDVWNLVTAARDCADVGSVGKVKTKQKNEEVGEEVVKVEEKHEEDMMQKEEKQKGQEAHHAGFMPTVEEIMDAGKQLPQVMESNGWCTYHGPDCAIFDDGTTFRSAFLRVNRKRALFRTKNGYLGLGPMYVKPGDVVALVAGSRVPVILRRGKKKGKRKGQEGSGRARKKSNADEGRLKFVGEAYVHGIMYGEVLRDDRKGAEGAGNLVEVRDKFEVIELV